MRTSFWFCCLVFLGIWIQPVKAADLIEQSAWLEDASCQLSVAEVQQRPEEFKVYRGVLTQGFQASDIWVRLRIRPSSEKTLVLRIRPSFLDRIELFDPLEGSADRPTPRFSGDHHPKQENDYISLNHGFRIQGSPAPRDIYLRVNTTSTFLLYSKVLTINDAAAADREQELIYSIYLGMLAAFIVWSFLQWLAQRDKLVAVFMMKQAIVLAYTLAHQGYLPLLLGDRLSAPLMSDITSLMVMAYTLSSAVFVLLLLREFKPVPWLWNLFASVQGGFLIMLGLFTVGETRLALRMNISLAALTVVGVVLLALSARAWQDKMASLKPLLPRSVLVGFAMALLLATMSTALPNLNFLEAAEWSLYAPHLAGLVNSLLMAILLSMRARNLEKQRNTMQLESSLFKQQITIERDRREEQARFLSMLIHELKTPLAVARISLDDSPLVGHQRQRIDRALTNINGIIDRCTVNDRLENQKLIPKLQACQWDQLLDECVQSSSDPSRVKVLERKEALVHTDSELLAICMANLIDNALKYSPPVSPIEVRLQPSPGGLAMTVRNTIGQAGTPDPQQAYTKYYRGRGAMSKSGTGLGLYLTRNLAELIGAEVTHRVDNQQVEFRLWLPA